MSPENLLVQKKSISKNKKKFGSSSLKKTPSGIQGLDEICGGLPKGRPTLVCGSAGCGKTLFSMEFLIRGILQFNEPGVFVSFEEREKDLAENVASLGFDLEKLISQKKLALEYIRIEKNEIEETGEYDLEGLFVRLAYAIDSVGAKRIVLDTIETLFAGLSNAAILRSELRRLFQWLKDKGITAIITGERGEGQLTRNGLEEYVSDCVILLDHRVNDQISTRRLRIVKYRGTAHRTNEYPFLIDEQGISVIPLSSSGLTHEVSSKRILSGIPRLDTMLGGGFYQGSSILISGTPGTGKSSVAAHFANATCKRGEKCLYFAFEESESQIMRNMKSIGLSLEPWVKKELLAFHATRPASFGLEMHLATMHKIIRQFKPSSVVIDPINNLVNAGTLSDVQAMLVRLLDFLKNQQITAFFTSLSGQKGLETTEESISSLMDTWILLRDIEYGGERTRGMYVLKSRGMAHSNQIREFILSEKGIDLLDVYQGADGVLTGSARASQEARERAAEKMRLQESNRKKNGLERKRKALQAQIAALEAELKGQDEELQIALNEEESRQKTTEQERRHMAILRKADET